MQSFSHRALWFSSAMTWSQRFLLGNDFLRVLLLFNLSPQKLLQALLFLRLPFLQQHVEGVQERVDGRVERQHEDGHGYIYLKNIQHLPEKYPKISNVANYVIITG